jgi:hypothetical protein
MLRRSAKALAVIFSYHKAPEYHGAGMYPHYHVSDFATDHVLHIWYGNPVSD